MKYINSDYTNANKSLNNLTELSSNISSWSTSINNYTKNLKRHCKGQVIDLIELRLSTYSNALNTLSKQIQRASIAASQINNNISSIISPETEISDTNIKDIKEKIGIMNTKLNIYYSNTERTVDGLINRGYISVIERELSQYTELLKNMENKIKNVNNLDTTGSNTVDGYKNSISKIVVNFM